MLSPKGLTTNDFGTCSESLTFETERLFQSRTNCSFLAPGCWIEALKALPVQCFAMNKITHLFIQAAPPDADVRSLSVGKPGKIALSNSLA